MIKVDKRQLELIAAHEWYGPHLAWRGCKHKVLEGVEPKRAELQGADLRGTDLRDADLRDVEWRMDFL